MLFTDWHRLETPIQGVSYHISFLIVVAGSLYRAISSIAGPAQTHRAWQNLEKSRALPQRSLL